MDNSPVSSDSRLDIETLQSRGHTLAEIEAFLDYHENMARGSNSPTDTPGPDSAKHFSLLALLSRLRLVSYRR